LLAGRLDEARTFAEQSVACASREPGSACYALRLLADVEAQRRIADLDDVEKKYRDALAVATSRNMRPMAAHCHASLAVFDRRRKRAATADAHFAAAMTMYQDMGMTSARAALDAQWRSLAEL
jgi:hypothetical protein